MMSPVRNVTTLQCARVIPSMRKHACNGSIRDGIKMSFFHVKASFIHSKVHIEYCDSINIILAHTFGGFVKILKKKKKKTKTIANSFSV